MCLSVSLCSCLCPAQTHTHTPEKRYSGQSVRREQGKHFVATMSSAHILARNFVATKSGDQETTRQPDTTKQRPLLERKCGRTQRPFVDHFFRHCAYQPKKTISANSYGHNRRQVRMMASSANKKTEQGGATASAGSSTSLYLCHQAAFRTLGFAPPV